MGYSSETRCFEKLKILSAPSEGMSVKKLVAANLLFVSLLLTPLRAQADTFANAVRFFDFAEQTYPSLLRPVGPETQEIQGYYVRYYSGSGIYLGLLGDNVYALGGYLGSDLTYAGKLTDFILVDPEDITNRFFSNARTTCSYFAESLFARAEDIQRNLDIEASVEITLVGDKCRIEANSIPNHSFNDETASFVDPVSAVNASYEVPLYPQFSAKTTPLSLEYDDAIFLNGVKLDLLAAGCFGVGDGRIGCFDIETPWRLDPMSAMNDFGVDVHNAHVQPGGQYHYHGNPNALFDQSGDVSSPVIGFAADGFPIFGSFIDDQGVIREVKSSYKLREGARPSTTDSPGGTYDGTYRDDWEYSEGLGDLDECNGMMRDGSYGYYVVDQYPWVLGCYRGTPDPSFLKRNGR